MTNPHAHKHDDITLVWVYSKQYTGQLQLLRSPYGIGQTIIYLPCGFFFLLSFFFLA